MDKTNYEKITLLLGKDLTEITKEVKNYIQATNRVSFEITYNDISNTFNLFAYFTEKEYKEYLDLKG